MPFLLSAVLISTFISGLIGMGGSLPVVTLLTAKGISFETARGIGLLVNVAGLAGGTVSNIIRRQVDFSICTVMAAVSLIAAPIGSHYGTGIPEGVLNSILAFYLVCVLVLVSFRTRNEGKREEVLPKRSLLALSGLGLFSGLFAGVLGIGGGSVTIPAMVMMGYGLKKVAVINTFLVCCSSLTGLAPVVLHGDLSGSTAVPVAALAFIGGFAGARVMQRRLSKTAVRYGTLIMLAALALAKIYFLFA